MKTDKEALREGESALGHARSQIHMVCDKIVSVVNSARESNDSPKFNRAADEIISTVAAIRSTAENMVELGRKLEQLRTIVEEFD